MENSFLPIKFPRASHTTLLVCGLGLIALFAGAVAIEFVRQRARRRRQTREQWRHVERLAMDRGLFPDHWQMLKDLLDRFAGAAPLDAVTIRASYDLCVAQFMAALKGKGNWDLFQQAGVMLREIRVALGLDHVEFGHPIRSTRDLRTGQGIWLKTAGGPAPRWIQAGTVRVDEALLQLAPQQDAANFKNLFRPGEKIACRFWREDDARYLTTLDLAMVSDDPVIWSFLHTEKFDRTQARCYYRVRCNQPTTVLVYAESPEQGKPPKVLVQFHGQVSSLSAGGLAVTTLQAPPRDRPIRVTLALPHEPSFDVDVALVATEPLSGGHFLIRGWFTNIDDDARDKIARYVAVRQLPALARQAAAPRAAENV